jgi:hypothetical protein
VDTAVAEPDLDLSAPSRPWWDMDVDEFAELLRKGDPKGLMALRELRRWLRSAVLVPVVRLVRRIPRPRGRRPRLVRARSSARRGPPGSSEPSPRPSRPEGVAV